MYACLYAFVCVRICVYFLKSKVISCFSMDLASSIQLGGVGFIEFGGDC